MGRFRLKRFLNKVIESDVNLFIVWLEIVHWLPENDFFFLLDFSEVGVDGALHLVYAR